MCLILILVLQHGEQDIYGEKFTGLSYAFLNFPDIAHAMKVVISSKMTKNAFHFASIALFVLKIFKLLS